MLSKLAMCVRSSAAARRNLTMLCAAPQRSYLNDLGLDSQQLAVRAEEGHQAHQVDLWKQQVEHTKNALVLKTNDEIEAYVISIVKDYFRTTRKSHVSLDSHFADHGLDSLDAIELIIRIEDELGYLIDAENLEKFKKPRHFVNFIKHMESYKEEFNKLPHEGNKAKFSFKEAFPGLPGAGH